MVIFIALVFYANKLQFQLVAQQGSLSLSPLLCAGRLRYLVQLRSFQRRAPVFNDNSLIIAGWANKELPRVQYSIFILMPAFAIEFFLVVFDTVGSLDEIKTSFLIHST